MERNAPLSVEALFECQLAQAKRVLLAPDAPADAELVPTWALAKSDGSLMIAATPFGSNLEKDLMVDAIKKLIKLHDVVSVSLLSEAWMVTQNKPPSGDDLPPSERPDRIEVVMISVEDAAGAHVRIWSVERGEGGKVTALTPSSKLPHEAGTYRGRFVGLLAANSQTRH